VPVPPAASGQNVQLRWRVGSDSLVGGTGWSVDTISLVNYSCSTAPPGPFGKSVPRNGETTVSLNPTLSWGSSASVTSYQYCIDTSNNATCDASWVSVGGSTSVVLPRLMASTTYSWQARAVNVTGTTLADGGTWWTFTTAALTNPLPDLAIDFGSSVGLWTYYDGGGSPIWQQLHGLSPSLLTRGDLDGNGLTDLVIDFTGYGVWAYLNNRTWIQIHGLDAADIKAGDLDGNGRDDLLISFPGLGLWVRYDNATWAHIHLLNPTLMTVGNIDSGAGGQADVIVNFAGLGLYAYYNNANWQGIHPNNATNLQLGDLDGSGVSDVIAQIDGHLLVRYNNTFWRPFHPLAAAGFVTGNIDGDAGGRADLVVNFPGLGVWAFMNNASWVQLHSLNSPVMTTGDIDGNGVSEVVLFFPSYGIYAFKNFSTWTGIHPLPPELMVTVRMNEN
jgi:hypothetical protein